MENATQALLIAGGVLIAILTVALLIYMFNNATTMELINAEKKDLERLAAWNQEWEVYNVSLLRGTEVLTVINKAEQNNIDNNNNPKYTVEVFAQINDEITTKSYIEANKSSIYFRCKEMEYSNETGRINKIVFVSVDRLEE